MAKWIVNEKGVPGHCWELTVINSESDGAAHLKSSYGWDGPNKIIVWSGVGPSHFVCSELLAARLRRVAQEHADELNNVKPAEQSAQNLEQRLCSAINAAVLYDGRHMRGLTSVGPATLPVIWAEARDEKGVFDSLDYVELMMALETEFGRPVSEDDMTALIRRPEFANVDAVLRWLTNTN